MSPGPGEKRFGSSWADNAAARMSQARPIRCGIPAAMVRDPYAERRDFTWLKRVAVGIGAALVLALVAYYLMRPARTAKDMQAAASASAQMDAAEKRWDEERDAAERERQALY